MCTCVQDPEQLHRQYLVEDYDLGHAQGCFAPLIFSMQSTNEETALPLMFPYTKQRKG